MGEDARSGIDRAFSEAGVEAHTTGAGSLFRTHFGAEPRDAEGAAGEDKGRITGYALSLMGSGIFVLPGHPAGVSTAHTQTDIHELVEKSGVYARDLQSTK